MDHKDWVDSYTTDWTNMKISWRRGHEKFTVEDKTRDLRHPIREKPSFWQKKVKFFSSSYNMRILQRATEAKRFELGHSKLLV